MLSGGEEPGAYNCRTWFGERSVHVLNRFDIARRFDRVSHVLLYFSDVFDVEDRLFNHQQQRDHHLVRTWCVPLLRNHIGLAGPRLQVVLHSPDVDAVHLGVAKRAERSRAGTGCAVRWQCVRTRMRDPASSDLDLDAAGLVRYASKTRSGRSAKSNACRSPEPRPGVTARLPPASHRDCIAHHVLAARAIDDLVLAGSDAGSSEAPRACRRSVTASRERGRDALRVERGVELQRKRVNVPELRARRRRYHLVAQGACGHRPLRDPRRP